MIIRDYNPKDELAWLRCRLMAFLDCSYFDDVKRKKDVYENPSINLVAEKDSQIVGFIDIEYQPEKSATIWDLGVLPEYRCLSIATKLFNEAKARLLKLGVKRIEVWTQDDIEA
ncbi:MAG TPA: GNAT family N-acetyltransferase, partial [Haloplasmataceae bacterium]